MQRLPLSLISLLLISTALTACGTTSKPLDTTLPVTRPITEQIKSSIDSELLYGETRDSLSSAESAYTGNSKDAEAIVRYGKALREAGDTRKARTLLQQVSDNTQVGTLANAELSAAYLSEGSFSLAESSAKKAIKQDGKNYRAWRNLGNALDAQEKYKEGEAAFRKSMELWKGDDKVPVMNNLALNLAAQGYTDQALTLLYDAKKIDPDRVEIERNIRIIRTLSEPPKFAGTKRPFPSSKAPE